MLRIVLLSTAIVAGFGVTQEADAKGDKRPAFGALDTDGNGAITATELRAFGEARLAERFAQADANGDGVLTQAEMEAARDGRRAGRITRVLARLDQNGDDALSLTEMQATGRDRDEGRLFRRLDTDGDGAITEAEFNEARGAFQDRRARRADRKN